MAETKTSEEVAVASETKSSQSSIFGNLFSRSSSPTPTSSSTPASSSSAWPFSSLSSVFGFSKEPTVVAKDPPPAAGGCKSRRRRRQKKAGGRKRKSHRKKIFRQGG